jgi:ATP-binding cassette, subfamily B, bacterial PglK
MPTGVRTAVGLLTRRDRRRASLLLAAIMLMALGEVVGIASILPFLSVVADPSVIERTAALSWLYERLGFTSVTPFLVFLGGGFLLVVVITSGVTALTIWLILRFTWSLNHTFSARLLARYLSVPYTFFLEQNTSDLGKNVLAETKQLVSGVILPSMQVLARGAAALLICLLLVVVDPGVALVGAAVLGGAYLLIYLGFRHALASIGHVRLAANRRRYTLALEALGGIKELKVLGRGHNYVERYRKPSAAYSDSQARMQAISQLPRYGLEVLAMAAIVAVTLYLLIRGDELSAVVPLLGLYALAGFRLLPALQHVLRSRQCAHTCPFSTFSASSWRWPRPGTRNRRLTCRGSRSNARFVWTGSPSYIPTRRIRR